MNLLILGGNSDVAYAAAQQFAANIKADVTLASRNLELLEKKARDLEIRWDVKARAILFDVRDTQAHKAFYESLDPKPDGVIAAFGYLGDQALAQQDFNEAPSVSGPAISNLEHAGLPPLHAAIHSSSCRRSLPHVRFSGTRGIVCLGGL